MTGAGRGAAIAAAAWLLPLPPGGDNPLPAPALWDRAPALHAETCYLVGNGRLQASARCDPRRERIELTDGAAASGALELEWHGVVLGYRRELDLVDGVATVRWSDGEHGFVRELLASRADEVVALRLRCDGGRFALRLRLAGAKAAGGDRLVVDGGAGSGVALVARTVGGTLAAEKDELVATDAVALVVLLALRSGGKEQLAPAAACAVDLERAAARPFDDLVERAAVDQRELMGRVAIELGGRGDARRRRESALDQRRRVVDEGGGADDPDLVATWVQLARHEWLAGKRGAAAWPSGAWNLDAGPVTPIGTTTAAESPPLADPFAAAATVAAQLLQSDATTIALLPALPKAWREGLVSGMQASGAVTVDLRWNDSALDAARLAFVAAAKRRVALPSGPCDAFVLDAKGERAAPPSIGARATALDERTVELEAPAACTWLLVARKRQ